MSAAVEGALAARAVVGRGVAARAGLADAGPTR